MQNALLEKPSQQVESALTITSQQVKAEIEAKFGFIPPFFEPAEQFPQVLENLWQQTLTAYVNNPLPDRFKEKLSAYLSRFCHVPYCMVCHSCTLRPLGLKAREVLQLLDAPPPSEAEIDQHLSILAAQAEGLHGGTELFSRFEESLLFCAIFIALEPEQADCCRQQLRCFLGEVTYQHLVTFLAYIKTCHTWIEAHPEIVYEADQRVKDHLEALLQEEPELGIFFRSYRKKIEQERQSRIQQQMEQWLHKQREAELRQQMERERLVAQISQRIRRSLNLSEILHTTVSEVRKFLESDRVFIYRFESDWSGVVAVESVIPSCLSIQQTKIKDSFFAQMAGRDRYRQGQIHAVDDIYTAGLSKCHLDLLARLQIRANLVVPIVQGEKLWGLLVANQCLRPRHWQSLELDLLQNLATQLAIAIQQSELYQQVQTELSERKRSEEKIRQQAALLEITSDAILVTDLEGQILFWNKGAERLYGWQPAEALVNNVDELLSSNTSPSGMLDTVRETGRWQGEMSHHTKDGKEIIVDSRWTLVLQTGQPNSILIVNTDITQKKYLEKQFLQSQRLENLGILAGGIVHDLNNILTPILVTAQLLQLKLPAADESIQGLLQLQEASAKRGAALVKQVLSFARRAEGQRTALQVKHLISELKQMTKETFPQSIEVFTTIEPDLWTVSADVIQLHQVLLNLCVNARDAMPNGGRLEISAQNCWVDESHAQLHPDAQVGTYMVITVSDTGTGISPAVVEHIFEPFFTTKELDKGTGLGLSTVTGIVKHQGGFIQVQTQVEQGTQFKVYLPAVKTSEMSLSLQP